MTDFADGFGSFSQSLVGAVPSAPPLAHGMMALDFESLRTAYLYSTWFGKIVDIPAEDSIRAGRGWQAEDEQIGLLEAEEQRLNYWPALLRALIWARCFGGSLIVMGGLPGRAEEPLDLNEVRKGSLRFITVIDQQHASVAEYERDPMQPGFGFPKLYNIGGGTTTLSVHASRVVRLVGRESPGMFAEREGFGQSIWTNTGRAIMAADLATEELAGLMRESKTDIIRLENLAQKMATKEAEDLLVKRWVHFLNVKKMTGVAMYDKNDEVEQRQISFTDLPEVVETLWTNMSGPADIPLVRLIGTSAKGLNATGDGDLKNYYDKITANQKSRLTPALQTLDEVLIRSTLGARPKEIYSVWNPLYTMSDKEKAEVQKVKAETAAIIINTGSVAEEPIAKALLNEMVESGEWSGLEAALADVANEGVIDPLEREQRQREAMEAMAGLKPANQNNTPPRIAANDAAPRTLYVYRKLINGADIVAWAKEQGFTSTLDASDMHVTITYSHQPVDWMAMGESWQGNLELPEGGPRLVEQFDGGAVVLLFNSSELRWRHDRMIDMGATYGHAEYQPHVTISYVGAPDNLNDVKPYTGKLVFGPEFFEELDPNRDRSVEEK